MTMALVGGGDRDGEGAGESEFEDPEFVAEVQEAVDQQAPRLFAVVREDRDAGEVEIAAWGMAHREDGAEVVSAKGGTYMSLRSADRALMVFGNRGRAVSRVVWVGGKGGE